MFKTHKHHHRLSNLFNAIPRRSGLRLPVYQTLLALASANDDLDVLGLSQSEVEKWLSEWEITPEEKSGFVKLIVDAYKKSEQQYVHILTLETFFCCGVNIFLSVVSYQYQLAYVRSLPPTSPEAQSAAIDAIAAALRLPAYFDFDSLFRLDAVVAAKDHELFSLLKIFLNDGLVQYKEWASSHSGAFAKYGMCTRPLLRRLRN